MLWVSQPWQPWSLSFPQCEESPQSLIQSKLHRGYALGFVSRQLQNDREATNSQHRQSKHEHIRQENTRRIWSEIAGHDSFDLSICQLFHCLWLSSHWTRIILVVGCSGRTGCSTTKWAGTWKGALETFFRGHVDWFPVILPSLMDAPQASTGIRCASKWQGGALTWAPTVTYWTYRKKLESKRGLPLKALRWTLQDASFTQDLWWNEVFFFVFFCKQFLKDLLWTPLTLEISRFLPWKNRFCRSLVDLFPVATRWSLLQWNEVLYPWNLPPRTAQLPVFIAMKNCQNSWNLRRCKMSAWNWGVFACAPDRRFKTLGYA